MNTTYKNLVEEFLQAKNIGVAGYSTDKNQPANGIYQKFKKHGYQVYAINPKADQVKDVPCYETVGKVPESLDALFIATPPAAASGLVKDAAEAGIKLVWLHQGIGEGSHSPDAVKTAKKLGLKVIPAGCPMMFIQPDIFHRCLKWFVKGKMQA